MKGVFRTDTGEIRFLWKLGIALVLTLVFIVISRISLILAVQQVFILQGTASSVAFQNAQIFVSESSEGQAIASLMDFALIFLLVLFFVRHVEKRNFALNDFGLHLQRRTLLFVGIGLIIGCTLFFGGTLLGMALGTITLPLSLNLSQWPLLSSLFASIIFYVFNSFWQEVLFRGYLQTRAVAEYGRNIGVIVVTVIFVVFHGLVQTLTISGIIIGILLFLFIGFLYEKTKSLYLVGVIHAVLNFMPILFNISFQGLEIIPIYGIALIVLLLGIHRIEQRVQPETVQTQKISTLHANQ